MPLPSPKDEFAASAMQAILRDALTRGEYFDVDEVATRSFAVADAMMKQSPACDWLRRREEALIQKYGERQAEDV